MKPQEEIWVKRFPWIIQFYYLYLCAASVMDIAYWTERYPIVEYRGLLALVHFGWPVLDLILTLCLMTQWVGILFWRHRSVRIAITIATLFQLSVYWSCVNPSSGHNWNGRDLLSLMSILLALISTRTLVTGDRLKLYSIAWCCRALLASTYFLSGLNKVLSGVAFSGQHTVTAFFLLQPLTDYYMPTDGILTPYLLRHEVLNALWLHLLTLTMLWTPFALRRRKTSLIWAVVMLIFHLGNALTLSIFYTHHFALIFLFFIFLDLEDYSFEETSNERAVT